MAQQSLAERVSDLQRDLIKEFTPLIPADTVERCLRESLASFNNARVPDFIPLFVHRETRARLHALAAELPGSVNR